ncbi:unnamed protein product [Phyllotreta striolata]|uniref:Apoptotic protease-activating factor 1 n=1 Tax=Phyllotreta striolata TaxID=444603 RepID=A0A9N9TRS2_PHYSR|nr:unnamed protein product [Phyllotreta striolata]
MKPSLVDTSENSLYSRINQYRDVVDFDTFVDFLYSRKYIDANDYKEVYSKSQRDRIVALNYKIRRKENLEGVLDELRRLHPHHDKAIEDNERLRRTLVVGEFPSLPPYYVTRKSLIEEVSMNLQRLEEGRKLVIHGMMGYGKSSLVNRVLNDVEILALFQNKVFWVNLGEYTKKEDLLKPLMCKLFKRVGSVLDKTVSHYPSDLDELKHELTLLFTDERLNKALIVLDDVRNRHILDLFDLKCRTVITTQDLTICNRYDIIPIKVESGFDLSESLSLFKKSLRMSGDNIDLPPEASVIHEICQGHPLLISLIGSYLNENATAFGDNAIWTHMIDLFSNGNYRLNEYSCDTLDVIGIIEQCVDNLLSDNNGNMKDFYHDLAIFETDVNIPPQVLAILWDKNLNEVRNIMNVLAEKSLVVRFFHENIKTYIYGIHNIYLAYLKRKTANTIRFIHKKLIAGYDRLTNKNYAELPNDNYTLQFIGHHLYQAEEFQKFDVYFDLGFLELKLKAVGKEDVLRDMTEYEEFICKGETSVKQKLEEYKSFIQRCGAMLFTYNKMSIVQCALGESKTSQIYRSALKLANESSHLYFQLLRPFGELDYCKIRIGDDITSACFVDSPETILVGTEDGRIKLLYDQKVLANFQRQEKPVKNLTVSPNRSAFLSLTEDGTVNLFNLPVGNKKKRASFNDPQSSKLMQLNWKDMYTSDKCEFPYRTFRLKNDEKITSAVFCKNFPETDRIATGTDKGDVWIWDVQSGKTVCNTGPRGSEASCLSYHKDSIMFSCQSSVLAFYVTATGCKYRYQLHNDRTCRSVFECGEKIITVSDTNVNRWKRKVKSEIFRNDVDGKENVCSVLTEDEKYLVVSTNQNSIYIYDLEEDKILREFISNGKAVFLDLFYNDDKSVHILLVGSDKKIVEQCNIQPEYFARNSRKIPAFTPFFRSKSPLTVSVTNERTLKVCNGYSLISESESIPSEITCTCFSSNGNFVIYGSSTGQIGTFDLRLKTTKNLFDLPQLVPINSLKCFDIYRGIDEDFNLGVIVGTFDDDNMFVYNDGTICTAKISKPVAFNRDNLLVVIDVKGHVYVWNVDSCDFVRAIPKDVEDSRRNSNDDEEERLLLCDYCVRQSLVCTYKENASYCKVFELDIDESVSIERNRIRTFDEKIRCLKFSAKGDLLAVGTNTGLIRVHDLIKNHQLALLNIHEYPVEQLMFAPFDEPILISLADEIAFWNLRMRDEKNNFDVQLRKKSNSISIWCNRTPLEGCLLSVIKLKDKAKNIWSSKDFNSFLIEDHSRNVHIMSVFEPKCNQTNGNCCAHLT